MADQETQELVRSAITSLAFGVTPYDALIRIAEGVGIVVMRDDEGHAYLAPVDSIWIGDTVRLTGSDWDVYGIRNTDVVITGIDTDGDPTFTHPGAPANYFTVFRSREGVDYSATLVKKAETSP